MESWTNIFVVSMSTWGILLYYVSKHCYDWDLPLLPGLTYIFWQSFWKLPKSFY